MGRPPISDRAMTPGQRSTKSRRKKLAEYEAAIVALAEYVPLSFVPQHRETIDRAYAAQKKGE